jgi:hypothetical protein
MAHLLKILVLLMLVLFTTPTFAQADSTPPVTTATLDPSTPDGDNSWYRSPLSIILEATDLESGVKSIHWKLNDNSWQVDTIPSSINLVPNPSYEEDVDLDDNPDSWTFTGTSGAVGGLDSASYIGSKSAKISAVTNGWSFFSYSDNYSVVSPPQTMRFSVWLKGESVAGTGAYFKVFALSPTGQTLLYSSDAVSLLGTFDWARISADFDIVDSSVYGVYVEVGVDGVGSLWVDGAVLADDAEVPVVDLTYFDNGEHTFYYYSRDQAGNTEPQQDITFKIDTIAPGNWQGFDVSNCGNDHSLYSWITVGDQTSGLQPFTDLFQYSIDAGETWGYYEDLTKCNDPWYENQWRDLSTSFSPGAGEVTLVTPCIDYCNSNWQVCKIVRFRIEDMAGNESIKDICINGAWSKVSGGGDVYAGSDITMSDTGGESNTDGLIVSSGTVTNFSSSQPWSSLEGYSYVDYPTYSSLSSQCTDQTAIASLPTTSGYFRTNGSFVIDTKTIPAGLKTADFSAVLFVNGDLVVNADVELGGSGAIVFVVGGDVYVDKKVNNLSGAFLVDGAFDTAYNGGRNLDTLHIWGSVKAESIKLSRSLSSKDNINDPAEEIHFEPKYFWLLKGLLGDRQLEWREMTD